MRALLSCALAACAAAVLAGCGKDVGEPPANRAPVTYLSIDAPAESTIGAAADRHVISYRQRMRWWGSDTDGRVVGYEIRIASLTASGAEVSVGDWFFTTKTDSIVDFPVDSTRVTRRFDVRAVDDDGARDPSPQSQIFALFDTPPTVTFKKSLVPATSLPALTVFWSGRDVDGGSTIREYRVWMKGTSEAQAMIVSAPDSQATLTPAMLAGASGARTAYIRAVDSGGLTGAADSVTWNVTALQGNVLLVDEYPDNQPGAAIIDRYYTTSLDTAFTATGYTLYKDELFGAFRSASEASALLGQFRYVVWYRDEYRGVNIAYSPSLANAQDGLRDVLRRGGGVVLSGTYLFGTRGGLTPAGFGASTSDTVITASGFPRDVCGITAFRMNDSLRTDFIVLGAENSVRRVIQGNAALGTESLGISVNPGSGTPPSINGVEALVIDPADLASGVGQVLWEIPGGQLQSQDRVRHAGPMPVGVLSTRAGGKAAFMGAPMALLNYYGNGWKQLRHLLSLVGAPVLVQ